MRYVQFIVFSKMGSFRRRREREREGEKRNENEKIKEKFKDFFCYI